MSTLLDKAIDLDIGEMDADVELEELREYRVFMEYPMQALAVAAGVGAKLADLEDHEIVTIATNRINTLKRMVLATGFNPDMLKAIMEDE
jgi:hypothetical protein